MSLNKDPDLKNAILDLPQREKDKLLVRLVGKDPLLMEQLHFQLLEDEWDLEKRVEALETQLNRLFDTDLSSRKLSVKHASYLLMQTLKYGSGLVNHHFSVTKDKMGDVKLRSILLRKSFTHFPHLFQYQDFRQNEKLLAYQTGRIKYVIGKYDKLHEDLQFEFRDELNEILSFAQQSDLKEYINALGLPKEL